jgi:SH2 domain-containing protein 4A
MGEHANDLKYEDMVEERNRMIFEEQRKEDERRAQELALQEIQELAKKKQEELQRKHEEMQRKIREEEERRRKEELQKLAQKQKQDEEDALYVNAKETRLAVERLALEHRQLEKKLLVEEEQRLQELKAREKKEMEDAAKRLELMKRQKERRTLEIYQSLKELRERQLQEAERELEAEWEKSEKKAKEYEKERRQSVRRAREQASKDLSSLSMTERPVERKRLGSSPVSSPSQDALPVPMPTVGGTLMRQSLQPARPAKPDSRQSVIAWFKQTEMPRGVMKDNEGKVNEWFHGILTRGEAENLLNNKEPGTFLVRVSEKIWGYTISVKANDRCKHFLIDAGELHYQFFGDNQHVHFSLSDLLEHHRTNPISSAGQELLQTPLGQVQDPPDYQELIS